MAVVSTAAKARQTTASAKTEREPSEFDGFWINPGIFQGSEDDAKHLRLPRGIAVSDLKERKVYEAMDPEFAAEVRLMNKVIRMIQAKCRELGEGESMPINLSCVLYRRQEEVDAVDLDPAVDDDLEAALFS